MEASLEDVMASSALTMDDMASVGLGELNMDEITGLDTGADVDVVKGEEGQEIDLSDLTKSSESAPIIKVSNLILIEALKAGASDIHVEPYEKEFRVRFRIDGILHNIMALPMRTRDPLISRLKIMAKLDISEKRLPQDGRIKIRLRVEERSRDLDLRVSSVPTHFGEKVVMRLLDKSKLQLDMTQLGFDVDPLRRFKDAIDRPYGIVLVTGPTGSGKTNTLYSAIAALNDPTVNIMTAEDPIEFNLAGINQVQMKEQIGLTFASALRSFLRQDPDIILVGEVRDFETAEIAVKAALTGHLVLSTLHTNDAPSTINRLMNMGIEPFLVATSVNCICAQRLVRRICTSCPEDVETPPQTLIQVGFAPDEVKTLRIKRGRGCDRCNQTGYKGRVGLFEVLAVHRRDPGHDSFRSVLDRVEAQGDRRGHDQPADVGPAEDPRGRHDPRRSAPGNRPVGRFRRQNGVSPRPERPGRLASPFISCRFGRKLLQHNNRGTPYG